MTETLSIADEVESIEGELEDIRDRADDLRAECDPEDDGAPDSLEDHPDYDGLDAAHTNLAARKRGLEEALDDWGTGEFEAKELTYGELMRAKDQVNEKSYEMTAGGLDGVPRDGFYRIKVLELAVVDSPAEAPDDPANYPPQVGQWLYDEVDAMNTAPGGDLGNLSLGEALDSRE